jgi:membrane protease YdiL (CAAX protease family)
MTEEKTSMASLQAGPEIGIELREIPLYAFLRGSEIKRRGLAIVVSNLVFSAAHAHIGLAFAVATFIPGLFWGWIFARTNSLLPVSLSHFLIGGAGIFLFGIEEFLQKLF